MEQYFIPLFLILGIIVAAIVTRWINWYAWGENMYKKKLTQERRRARMKGGDGDNERKKT